MSKNKHTGNMGEALAADYLQQLEFSILHRNWRHKHWEVDIIACKQNKLHFIEVKTRTNEVFGKPEESINNKKMAALKNAAEEYLFQNPSWQYIQFDVIAITLHNNSVQEIFMIEDVYF
jgi:putative endonuclease